MIYGVSIKFQTSDAGVVFGMLVNFFGLVAWIEANNNLKWNKIAYVNIQQK